MDKKYLDEISDYYERSGWLYKTFWYGKKSLGLHFGYWDSETKSHEEAIVNQYKHVLNSAKIMPGMRVLDAGCGVGGGAIYIAKSVATEVVGITISKSQVKLAKMYAKRTGVGHLTDFVLGDYTRMPFPNNYFDCVYAVESVCHATPKRAFLKEAFRVLKPGGCLVINDGYRKREARDLNEKAVIARFCKAFRLRELVSVRVMTKEIRRAGFKNIKVTDKTEAVLPSLKKIQRLLFIFSVPIYLADKLPLGIFSIIRDNATALRMTLKSVNLGLTGHYSHTAVKL